MPKREIIMKKKIFLLLVCFALVAAVGLTGCNKNNDPPVPPVTTVTVTFVQTGEENIVKTVEFGGTLTDIPTPAARDGFIVAWNRTDFSGLVEDITVYATLTPVVTTVTVTFVQAGEADIVKTVDKGGSLAAEHIPAPKPVDGHTVSWDYTGSYENLQENLTVNAVVTPNLYTVTYEIGDDEILSGAAGNTDSAAYGSPITLRMAFKLGYRFVGWKNKADDSFVGFKIVYNYRENITLVPQFEADSESGWTGDYPGEEFAKHVITYDVGEDELIDDGVVGEDATQEVYRNSVFALKTASKVGYRFLGWKISGSQDGELFTLTRYTLEQNITLVPVFELTNGGWTGDYGGTE